MTINFPLSIFITYILFTRELHEAKTFPSPLCEGFSSHNKSIFTRKQTQVEIMRTVPVPKRYTKILLILPFFLTDTVRLYTEILLVSSLFLIHLLGRPLPSLCGIVPLGL